MGARCGRCCKCCCRLQKEGGWYSRVDQTVCDDGSGGGNHTCAHGETTTSEETLVDTCDLPLRHSTVINNTTEKSSVVEGLVTTEATSTTMMEMIGVVANDSDDIFAEEEDEEVSD